MLANLIDTLAINAEHLPAIHIFQVTIHISDNTLLHSVVFILLMYLTSNKVSGLSKNKSALQSFQELETLVRRFSYNGLCRKRVLSMEWKKQGSGHERVLWFNSSGQLDAENDIKIAER